MASVEPALPSALDPRMWDGLSHDSVLNFVIIPWRKVHVNADSKVASTVKIFSNAEPLQGDRVAQEAVDRYLQRVVGSEERCYYCHEVVLGDCVLCAALFNTKVVWGDNRFLLPQCRMVLVHASATKPCYNDPNWLQGRAFKWPVLSDKIAFRQFGKKYVTAFRADPVVDPDMPRHRNIIQKLSPEAHKERMTGLLHATLPVNKPVQPSAVHVAGNRPQEVHQCKMCGGIQKVSECNFPSCNDHFCAEHMQPHKKEHRKERRKNESSVLSSALRIPFVILLQ